jgi:hypothetical protein
MGQTRTLAEIRDMSASPKERTFHSQHYANEMMMKAEPKGPHLATFDWGDLRALRPSQKNLASQNDFNPF